MNKSQAIGFLVRMAYLMNTIKIYLSLWVYRHAHLYKFALFIMRYVRKIQV